MKKLAIIGASYLQNPLILKAKEMGLETHVFAWAAGDIGEKTADFFYPISIVEVDTITEKCREIGIDGIATIASDLAAITVGRVANALGLVANSNECVDRSTNKSLMRRAFEEGGDPSPRNATVRQGDDLSAVDFDYPVIVKPSDRSGSRGVTKLMSPEGLQQAVDAALQESFEKAALIEEFVEGDEFSVEYLSWKGDHRFLSVTEKFTTGAPHFIEKGHLEPARISAETEERIRRVVAHALGSLGVEYGASHSEVKVNADGTIKIIEIGARMGGDDIGSDLVQLSTGYDFLKAVIDVALGVEPDPFVRTMRRSAGVRFVFSQEDLDAYNRMCQDDSDIVVRYEGDDEIGDWEVVDSSTRFGCFLFASDDESRVARYLPDGD